MRSRKVRAIFSKISLFMIVLVISLLSFPHSGNIIVSADYNSLCGGFTRFGRSGCHGYFANTNYYTTFITGWNILNCQFSVRGCINGEAPGNVLPSSINTASEFENEIGYYLNSGYTYNHAGAAFIIDAMLGRPGSSFGSVDAGINYAIANFSNWKTNYVDYYASKGWITWNQATTLPAGNINSMHACTVNYDCTQSNIVSHDGKDLVFFKNPSSEAANLIVFHNPGGSVFEIRRQCANLVGSLTPLTKMPPPVATAACDGFTSDVLTPDPNRAFNLTASINISPDTSAPGMFGPDSMKIALTGPAPYAGVSVTDTTPTISSGEVSTTLHVPPTNTSGTFTVTWSITGSAAPNKTCSDTIDIAYVPFFTARGGDISAGQGFGNNCTDNPSAEIDGENLDDGSSPTNYFGAAASNAAIATGNINQFATDTTNNVPSNLGGSSDGLSANQPSGLAFANSAPAGAEYGGDVLGSWPGTWCVPDYVTSADTPTGTFNPTSLTSGTYTLSGTSIGGFTVPAGVHITVIASSGVYINGDIKFASYTSMSQMPQFTLLVKGGDIYIDHNVKTIHGFYDAEPDAAGVGGSIFTCATALGAPSTNYATCNVTLTLYGAVASNQIIPGRTAGDVAKGAAVTDVPAEQFVYTPELWLGAVTAPTMSCVADPTQPNCMYQAYTTLPPVL